MNTNENDKSKVHSVFDGIVEENNPMPTWWSWLFILTVIYAFLYWLHYEMGGGPSLKQEYDQALAIYQKNIEKNAAELPTDTEESLTTYMKNEKFLLEGAQIFSDKCAMCHGLSLEGKIGPNLTDEYWVNGTGQRRDIVKVISNGSTVKGMPAWQSLLKPTEIKNVAAFVFSKIGSNPVNPKAPDGLRVKKEVK